MSDRIRPSAAPRSAVLDKPLIDLISGLSLHDMWRVLRKGEAGHSYFHQKGSARLDRIYGSRHLVSRLSNIVVDPSYVSDHFVLRITLCGGSPVGPARRPAPTLWKLNTSILPEEAYVEKITKFLSHATAHPLRASDLLLWWETIFKPGILGCFIFQEYFSFFFFFQIGLRNLL